MYVAVTDCWRGLKRAVELGLYVPSSFDVREYFYYDTNGDLHEVVKGKLFAFRGPVDAAWRSRSGRGGLAPGTLHAGDYIEVFRSLKVTTIIRLNSRQYHREVYTKAGFRHHDIIFPDCTLPPDSLVDAFLRIAEAHKDGAIAIHCMAGLGRTGTMVGLYLMKHLGFSADEAMGWLRIARPGSVIGPQQQYLKDNEARMWSLARLGAHGLGLGCPASPAFCSGTPSFMSYQSRKNACCCCSSS